MYRSSGEMPRSNYYPGPGVPPAEAGSNAWYWDGTQYQLQTQMQPQQQQYYGNPGNPPPPPPPLPPQAASYAGNTTPAPEEVQGAPSGPPDLVTIPAEEEDETACPPTDSMVAPSPVAGRAAGGHEEHYAFYEQQQQAIQPPDVLQRSEASVVPSSDRNLYMETGHLDDGDVPQMDRLVLGEPRWVPGINSSDAAAQGLPRSEAVGADRQEEDGSFPPSMRNVEGGDEERPRVNLPEEEEEPTGGDYEEEEEDDNQSIHAESRRDSELKESRSRGGNHHHKNESRHNKKPRSRHNRSNYSPPPEHERAHRRREDRRSMSPPSSDEYQRGPSRRNSRRYSSKYAGSNNNNNNKSYRGHDSSSYYYDDHASMRSDRSYVEDHRRRSHHHHPHNRSLYYDHPSRPSSRASNYAEYDYQSRSRRHYDPYGYAPPMPDPGLLENFRKNWEYYSRHPAQMEALRISNPVQHATLLRYYQMYSHLLPAASEPQGSAPEQQEEPPTNGHRPSSRTSVHSGQSSIAYPGEVKSEAPPLSVPEDVTPLKFCAPHVNGCLGANGLIALVHAKNPKIGQTASVDLIPLAKKMSEDVPSHMRNLKDFPGPLIPGRTHKGEVIRFCQNKISSAAVRKDIVDKESYVLLWELLILLLRQKNAIDGSDIAELLLKDRPVHEELNNGKADEDESSPLNSSAASSETEEGFLMSRDMSKITSRFRDYLLYGHKKEGLEYAMKHGLWGHALFLASKMDERSYSNVMLRFANGITANDPLQTLYQQMSGRQPIAMKESADWGDWRPHLAMILSNPSQKSGLDHKSILTLGDNLYEKGFLYASQFCYLMINLELGSYSDASAAKLVLLGADHLSTAFKTFTSNVEAVQCTEIFEYVQKLSEPENPGISSFVFYKYLYTLRLLDFGLHSTALHYIEIIAETLAKKLREGGAPIKCDYLDSETFMQQVLYLGDRLKYLDPKYTTAEGEKSEIGDPEWLNNYRSLLPTHSAQGIRTQEPSSNHYGAIQEEEAEHQGYTESGGGGYVQVEHNGQIYYYDGASGQYYLAPNQPEATLSEEQIHTSTTVHPLQEEEEVHHHPYQSGGGASSMLQETSSLDSTDAPPMIHPIPPQQSEPFQRSRQESFAEGGMMSTLSEEEVSHTPPQIIPSRLPPQQDKPDVKPPVQPEGKKAEAKPKKPVNSSSGGGLLGRIFGRLVAPPNQVHLPDDKDGDIVWDEKKKRWVDSNADPEEEAAANAPPPSDMDLLKKSPSMGLPPMSGAPPSGGNNRFSARGLRGRVDVFKNSMSAPSLTTLAPPPPPPAPMELPPTTPLEDNNSSPPMNEPQEETPDLPPSAPPVFYNPNQFNSMAAVGKTRRNKYV